MTDEAPKTSALPHHCAKCLSRWGGYNTAHCAACHTTFTGLTAFDRHRDGSHTKGRYCRLPEEVGLVPSGRQYRCWGFPAAENDFWNTEEEND